MTRSSLERPDGRSRGSVGVLLATFTTVIGKKLNLLLVMSKMLLHKLCSYGFSWLCWIFRWGTV